MATWPESPDVAISGNQDGCEKSELTDNGMYLYSPEIGPFRCQEDCGFKRFGWVAPRGEFYSARGRENPAASVD